NDAGSGSPEWYVNWLAGRNKDLGIAHYYITKDCIARVIDTNLIGYHTGHWPSNQRYIGYEVCQSMSASDADFLANEDMTLMQAAEDLLFYGLPINGNTVRLHHE
ncbi:N-acetylmuramoyl-L-alanine amidase, partial [Enterococcus faecium]